MTNILYSSTQRRAEVEFESLFSNCDFSNKQMATDHRPSSQDGEEDSSSAARIFVPMKILFVLSSYCVKMYFTTLNFSYNEV